MLRQLRTRRRRGWGVTLWITVVTLVLTCGVGLWHSPRVLADSPAVTDFGQSDVRPVWASDTNQHALFLTLYRDGRRDVQMRTVTEDAVAGFAGDHPAWQLDRTLTWFVRMPVYIRVVSSEAYQSDVADV